MKDCFTMLKGNISPDTRVYWCDNTNYEFCTNWYVEQPEARTLEHILNSLREEDHRNVLIFGVIDRHGIFHYVEE